MAIIAGSLLWYARPGRDARGESDLTRLYEAAARPFVPPGVTPRTVADIKAELIDATRITADPIDWSLYNQDDDDD